VRSEPDASEDQACRSGPCPRQISLEQIAGQRMAYERRLMLPMKMTVSVVVRGLDRRTLERRTKRFVNALRTSAQK
jgi:hypothetical protein